MPDVFRANASDIAKQKIKDKNPSKKAQKATSAQKSKNTRAALQRVCWMWVVIAFF